MKKIKSILTVLLIALIASFSTSCKKDKTKVQTELPPNYDNQGTITVKSKNLHVCVYDNSAEDGDVLDLLVNGNTLLSNYEILNTERCLDVTVSTGNNWIGVIARNEGTNPPCSATVTIDDGDSVQSFSIDAKVDKPGGYIIKL